MHYSQTLADCSLVKLVSWQKWYHLEEVLQRDEQQQAMPPFDDRARNRLPEEHILHLACQHQAPPRILELLAKKFPVSVRTPEKKGRFPLHIACAKGLKPKSIQFLINSCSAAAGVQDDYGKTPLHYVCESYEYNFRLIPSNAYRQPQGSTLQVVQMLLDRVPEGANVEDLYGMNAIEYAIDSDTDIDVIKLMQNASRESWRSMQKTHQGKSHEELRQSISSIGSSNLSSSMNSLSLNWSSENLESLDQESKLDDDRVASSHIDSPEKKVQVARTA
jgi:hypothetical protein